MELGASRSPEVRRTASSVMLLVLKPKFQLRILYQGLSRQKGDTDSWKTRLALSFFAIDDQFRGSDYSERHC